MLNPFEWRTVLLAKHAQHVVLVHFPIALFIAGVAFDLIAQWTKRRGSTEAAYYNLLVAPSQPYPYWPPASSPGSSNSRGRS